jgi:hypothetical protein
MKRWMQGLCIVVGSIIVTVAVLAGALAWGPQHCKPSFPMVIGCALGSYEDLAAGIIASAAALIAGWLAWSGVQVQIEADQKRAVADRVEVEDVLKQDIDAFAEALGSIWKILEGLTEEEAAADQTKIEAIIYGIEAIAKENWLSTSRRMVTVLGWERRRRFEELFDGLERLRRFRNISDFNVDETLDAVNDVSIDFEVVQPETAEYFKGLFRRGGKAWTLGYAIERMAGLPEEEE